MKPFSKLSALWRRIVERVREELPLLDNDVISLTPGGEATLRIGGYTPSDLAGATFSPTAKERRIDELRVIEENSRQTAIKRNVRDKSHDLDAVEDTRKIESAQLTSVSGLGGGRVSVDTDNDLRITALSDILTFTDDNGDRSSNLLDLTEAYVKRLKPSELIEKLSELSPEMSRALTDYLLMCNPGYEAKALDWKTDEQNEKAQDVLDAMIDQLGELYTSADHVWNLMFSSAFLRGSVASELVLDLRGRTFVDIAVIDPLSVISRRAIDKVRGPIWTLWQRKRDGGYVDLNIPQFSYVPINPFFKHNRGRSIAKSAVFVCFFLIATLQDLRRVIRQQGYPRIDISVDLEKLKGLVPQGNKAADLVKLKEFGDQLVKEVKEKYRNLKPDDTYIHSNVVTVNQPVGALNASSLGIIGDLIKGIERMATRALKSMPLLMATTDGASEANANRQWEIYVALIKSHQHAVEATLEKHFTLALRASGVNAYCEFRFAELRAAEQFRDAQVELLNTEIARAQYDNGSISADEMAQKSAGKEKADTPEPRASADTAKVSGTQITQATGANPEPGSSRFVRTMRLIDAVSSITKPERVTAGDIKEAADLWREFSKADAKNLINAKEETDENADDAG